MSEQGDSSRRPYPPSAKTARGEVSENSKVEKSEEIAESIVSVSARHVAIPSAPARWALAVSVCLSEMNDLRVDSSIFIPYVGGFSLLTEYTIGRWK
jgi:hypothetical protein